MFTGFNNRPIWVRLVSAIWAILVVLWSGMIYWTYVQQKDNARDQAVDFANSVHQMTMAALTGMMITGTVDQRAVYLDQIKNSDNINDLEVLRGDPVTEQFGPSKVPGRTPTEEELSVLKGGPAIYRVDEAAGYLKAVIPAVARKNYLGKDCLMCHMVPEGSVVGAVSLQISLTKINDQARNFALEISGLALFLSFPFILFVYLFINRAVSRPLHQVLDCFEEIGKGNYDNRIEVAHEDEIGKVLHDLSDMQDKLKRDMGETRRVANEMLRIKIALDNVSTGVMIADAERHIIYANRSVQRILGSAEADIRRDLPNFEASKLIGSSIDQFHRNPAHQARLLSELRSTHPAAMTVGGHAMVIVANPVANEQGEKLGTVVEWSDRTAEVEVEQEVDTLVQAALNGDFDQRLSLEGKQGFILRLAEGLNRLSETTSESLAGVVEVLEAVSKGDLTRQVDADYGGVFGQLKNDTNRTVERLRTVVADIQMASDAINTASKEIAAGNQDLSGRTEEQASSLEETSSSMEELNVTVRQNAESARSANELAKSAYDTASQGGDMVKRVVTTMSDIQSSSRRIADIIGVIDSIAFQTNILALNAAVEAARAGEQGRGFAVVATEVRNLAHRSASAAKEIKQLISESVDKVEAGARLVQETGSTIDNVVTSFQQVANLVVGIANASNEQATGIAQVADAVSQMDEVTQQNAALVEQAAAAAESLEEQARSLVNAVSIFKLSQGAALPPPKAKREASPPPAEEAPASARRKPLPLPSLDDEWAEF